MSLARPYRIYIHMNKNCILIIVSAVLILSALVYCVATTGPERPRRNSKVLVSKRKHINNIATGGSATSGSSKRAKRVETVRDESSNGREKPVLLKSDDEESFAPEIRKLLENMQDALDREDRKGVSQIASLIQEMLRKGGPNAVPVAVRMKAVEAISWFLPDTLADLVPFMGDSSPEVIDDVMTAFEGALDNTSLGDRELSQIVKSISRALSNEDALDALFFCIETDMRNSVAVETYKYLMENSSAECKSRVIDSIADFTGEENIKTEEDLDNWLKENPDDEGDEDFYAGLKEEE